MKLTDISSRPIAELEQIISVFPWFAYARKELFLKLSAKGEEYMKEAAKKEVLYLYPDRRVFSEAYVLSKHIQDSSEEQVYKLNYTVAGPSEEKAKHEVIVVGGDYFSKEDFKELQKEGGTPFVRLGLPNDRLPDIELENNSEEFKDENFYTETLAKIYAEQELYERAYEVYDKLILLYPEKSIYFATLKDEIKKHL